MLLQATFPGQPIFSKTSPFRSNPVPLPPTLPVDFDSSSLQSVHHSCAPLDVFDYHQLYLTTPRTNQSIWAVTWSSFISSPVLVRITFGTDWSSLNYKIEHWIVTPSTSKLHELVAASTNYNFLVSCIQPGCLSSLPIQDSFSTSICASMEHSPLMALRIFDIHSINRRPGIYYSKI